MKSEAFIRAKSSGATKNIPSSQNQSVLQQIREKTAEDAEPTIFGRCSPTDSNLTTAAAKLVGSIEMYSGKSSAYKLLNNSAAALVGFPVEAVSRLYLQGCIFLYVQMFLVYHSPPDGPSDVSPLLLFVGSFGELAPGSLQGNHIDTVGMVTAVRGQACRPIHSCNGVSYYGGETKGCAGTHISSTLFRVYAPDAKRSKKGLDLHSVNSKHFALWFILFIIIIIYSPSINVFQTFSIYMCPRAF